MEHHTGTAPEAEIAERPDARSGGVTFRVILLCLGLAVVFGYVIPIIDVKLRNTFLGATHLPPGAIAVLLVLLLVVNPLGKLVSKRLAFSRNETLTVYITCLFSTLVPGHGSENFFVSNIIAPFYFATRENKWLEFLEPNLRPWFSPALDAGGHYSRPVVESWYMGVQAGGDIIPWSAWIVPLLAWGALILASYVMLACLGVMLRAQWGEREALAFPLLTLPLAMTEDLDHSRGGANEFFRNSLMWMGFGIAAFVQLLNGLNLYFPDVPAIPLSMASTQLFTEAPWNQIGDVGFRIWPIAVGITYLLTAEVSFSLWAIFWLVKLQLIAAYLLGYAPSTLPAPIGYAGPGPRAFASFQQVGAFFAFAALIVWAGREHFAHIARRAFGRALPSPEEKNEALSYPSAFWGFLVSFAFLVIWCCAAGIRLDVTLAMWASYLVIALVLTRVVAESGLLFVQQGWTPLGTFAQLTGSGPGTWLTAPSIVPGMFVQGALMSDLRAFLLPSFVQSFKLAHDRKINARPLLALIFAVIAITLVMGMVMRVKLGYDEGGISLNRWFAQMGGQLPASNSKELLAGARDSGLVNWIWMTVGGVLTWGMMMARGRYLWFPFHPVGYVMALTGPMYHLWLSIFIGWGCKVLITRFGGSDTYRKTIPLFLGLALGDAAMMLFWLLIDGWQGRTAHLLMPS